MAEIEKLKSKIVATIYPNGRGEISAASHQAMLLEMAEAIEAATTPSGDPLHYNYIVVGAEYNDTDAPIIKTDYYGNAISHLPGRWYVEGIGDLTNAEIREIYEGGKWWWSTSNEGFCSQSKARAILPSLAFQNAHYKSAFNFMQAFNKNASLEVIDLRPQPVLESNNLFNMVKSNAMNFLCQESPKVRCIYGIIDASAAQSSQSFWIHTAGLVDIRLYNIKKDVRFPISQNISKASILYIIENEAVESSATIILHANAYTRLSADADIVAALAAHPKVSLAKA